MSLEWDAFIALPQVDVVNDIHCVTQWSRYDNHWQGVPATALLALARPPCQRHRKLGAPRRSEVGVLIGVE